LASRFKEGALVKLRFVSNSNQVEYLWAELLEVLGPAELGGSDAVGQRRSAHV